MFLLRRQPPPPDRTDIVLATCINTNMYSCPPYHPTCRACGIRLVEIKYLYTWRMSIHRDHSEYDPSGSPGLWETPISREVPHSLKYELFSLPKLCFFACSSVPLTDLSIGVSLVNTSLVSPLFRGASLLQTTRQSTTTQD
ncbi:hypothetical protein TIFTF001_030862 [Ficus carica]|uniref:Uncharacterized protein n=1 Tax=Ficus carica TaxID=3494 RepID=A0AA88DVC6_FICCA|nr:hypothetical protein TIFTF001_030862 [Ficus carica]